MRAVILLVATIFLLMDSGGRAKPTTTTTPSTRQEVSSTSGATGHVDFDTQVKPIFQSKCMPCHFNGGQMYERLPFDRGETIKKLGTRVFSRIRDEEERRLIEQFIKQTP
jgi:hypothetical protein